MVAPTQPTSVKIPLINFQFELTAKDKKVLAVAIATLVLLGVQLGASIPFTLLATYFVTTLTHFSETNIRTEPHQQNDWFNTEFDQSTVKIFSAFLILRPIVIRIFCHALGIPLPGMPQEGVVKLIIEKPWRMIPMATIVAPIAEEILFRGFLLERFEDLTHLLNRHKICLLSQKAQQEISNIAQAIIFGAVHLTAKIEEGMMIPVVFSLSFFGYIGGLLKRQDRTLISPVVIHSANNVSAVMHIFAPG